MIPLGQISSYGLTQKGQERLENQDAFLALPERGLFFVVDAFGDARAAAIALQVFATCLDDGRGVGVWKDAAQQVHRALVDAAHSNVSLRGIGVQFAGLLIDGDKLRLAWMGQCRGYRWRAGETQALTQDDPTLGCRGPYDLGTEEETFVPYAQQVLGGDADIRVHEIEIESPLPGDTYLLSTDGLHGLYEDRIHECFDEAGRETLPRLVACLVEHARAPEDDVTALCIRIGF